MGEVREKFSSELTISLARKVCLAILSSSFEFLLVAGNLLGQHLRVGGNHRQRRVHFVRHARRQQADGAELVGLHQAPLQLVAIRDVVENDQPPDLLQILRDQRRDRDIQRMGAVLFGAVVHFRFRWLRRQPGDRSTNL